MITRPGRSSTSTRSVNVPPISTPIRTATTRDHVIGRRRSPTSSELRGQECLFFHIKPESFTRPPCSRRVGEQPATNQRLAGTRGRRTKLHGRTRGAILVPCLDNPHQEVLHGASGDLSPRASTARP